MNYHSFNDFPVASRVKVFLVTEIFYEGIVALHLPRPPLEPPAFVIEDGNKKQLTFVFFRKLDGTEGWALIPNDPSADFALRQEDPVHIITKVEIQKGTKRFSFVECTCPEKEKGIKHGHIFDIVEGKNSPHIYSPKDSRKYFKFLKEHGRILCEDWDGVLDAMKQVRN